MICGGELQCIGILNKAAATAKRPAEGVSYTVLRNN